MAILKPERIKKNLASLNSAGAASGLAVWKSAKNSIHSTFVFQNFSQALAFAVRAGIEAEKADHHPDILIHAYKKVKITLSTHSEGGVTKKDFALAQAISKLTEEKNK